MLPTFATQSGRKRTSGKVGALSAFDPLRTSTPASLVSISPTPVCTWRPQAAVQELP
jgi:hypothetical protein